MGGIVRSVFGGSSYTPPPAPAPAPEPAITDVKTQARGKLGKKGRYDTLLTGGEGISESAKVRKSTLGG